MENINLLETKNIIFTKVSMKLIDEYLELVNDKSIQKFTLTKEKEYSREKEMSWINNVLENNDLVFSMIEKYSNKFIGNASLDKISVDEAEIAISIKNSMQNKGYGLEALKTLIRYARKELNFKSLIAIIFSNNERGLHCFQKLGFSEYKRENNVKEENGQCVDDVYLRLEL